MREFSYILTEEEGIHARPAGLLVKEANRFSSEITIHRGAKSANVRRIFSLMALSAKKGEQVIIRAQGPDEDQAIAALEEFMKNHL